MFTIPEPSPSSWPRIEPIEPIDTAGNVAPMPAPIRIRRHDHRRIVGLGRHRAQPEESRRHHDQRGQRRRRAAATRFAQPADERRHEQSRDRDRRDRERRLQLRVAPRGSRTPAPVMNSVAHHADREQQEGEACAHELAVVDERRGQHREAPVALRERERDRQQHRGGEQRRRSAASPSPGRCASTSP